MTAPNQPAGSSRDTVSVSVGLLDTLMSLAGELVLSRNQLLQGMAAADPKHMALSGQRIDLITSELQDAVMRTRMCAADQTLAPLKEMTENWAGRMEKAVNLTITADEVYLDTAIAESVAAAMEHIIRDLVEQSMETPEDRAAAGKDRAGRIRLTATKDTGQISLTIRDDGRGADAGRMTARTNQGILAIEQMGGTTEFPASPGRGTDIRIKLPLTLSIIPCQMIRSGDQRYAIPQTDLNELIRIPVHRIDEQVKVVGDLPVVRVRDDLLPLVDLSAVLGGGEPEIDATTPLNIAVVSSGGHTYGLVVDRFNDAEEIVVKSLGRHLNQALIYAGATIMGDGRAALILDIARIGHAAGISRQKDAVYAETREPDTASLQAAGSAALITFKNTESEYYCTFLDRVARIERVRAADIETAGGKTVVQYRGGALSLYALSDFTDAAPLPERPFQEVIVLKWQNREIGLLATPPVDTLTSALDLDEETLKAPAVPGSLIINGRTARLIDVDEMVRLVRPDWCGS